MIYYYHDERLPLYVLAAYAKNEQGSLSLAERNRLRQVTTAFAAIAKGRN